MYLFHILCIQFHVARTPTQYYTNKEDKQN
jgi:hypothetical protein